METARVSGIITPASETNGKEIQYLWKHNDPASRKEVFALFNTLLMVKKMRDQTSPAKAVARLRKCFRSTTRAYARIISEMSICVFFFYKKKAASEMFPPRE